MILAIDIGNSRTVIGVFDKESLIFKAAIETSRTKTEYEYASAFYSILTLHGISGKEINGAVVSSVVPVLNTTVKKAIELSLGIDALVVGPGVKTGLKIKCDDPASVGADLICASVAACDSYTCPCLIVDMDTATKLIYVDRDGAFSGVVIAPGMNIALDALVSGASQLPEVSLEVPKKYIGKNTADSIRSGVIYGNAAMIDGMIDNICTEVGEISSIVATGELIPYVLPHLKHKPAFDEDLLLRGLRLIYERSQSKAKK